MDFIMNAHIYAIGDADRIRERIEHQLLSGNLDQMARFSAELTASFVELIQEVEKTLCAETIMAGGDDVLFRIARKNYSSNALKNILTHFQVRTGCTISFGVGHEITQAYLNLRRAKAGGGGTIVADGVDL